MAMGLFQGMDLRLEQKLSPQMIQSLKLLQVNALQLDLLVKQEAEMNPLLELDDEPDQRIEDIREKPDKTESPEEKDSSNDEKPEDIDWEAYLNDGFDLGFKQSENLSAPDPDEAFERSPTYSVSLQDELMNQLRDRCLKDPNLVLLVNYLIDSMGPDGYLHPTDPELLGQIQGLVDEGIEGVIESVKPNESLAMESPSPLIECINQVIEGELPLEDAPLIIREAFHVLQSFDPAGIGARNLHESLLLQARRKQRFSPLAMTLLEVHFELLKNLKIPALSKKLGVTPLEIQEALKEIGSLNPHPGALLGDSPSPVIIPDIIVEEDEFGRLMVLLNDRSQPRLRISKAYASLLQNQKTGKEEKKFIKERLNSANWLIKAIDQRKSTITRVMEVILELQEDFFRIGPHALKPMILQDVADRIEMHISTVNRVTNGKFAQTPQGVYELKHFFSARVKQEDGSDLSAAQAKSAISDLVNAEDTKKPLSDQKITEVLKARGMEVARRTVAKYREQLGILSARMRKKY